MQAYEHILTPILYINTQNKQNVLEHLRRYAAYYTYPDSIRGAVGLTFKDEDGKLKPYRQPSHFSDGAGMEFIIGKELKSKCAEGYPKDKIIIPNEGIELKAADGKTLISEVSKINPGILNSKQGCCIFLHLVQDTISYDLFQSEIATCYVEGELGENNGSVNVYGVETKNGLTRFEKTGKKATMDDFRKVVYLFQKLSTIELYKMVKQRFPDITFKEIQEAANESYDSEYPECMMNAKKYIIPSSEEQERINQAIESGEFLMSSYYKEIKQKLVTFGAFNSIEEVDNTLNNYISKIVNFGTREMNLVLE